MADTVKERVAKLIEQMPDDARGAIILVAHADGQIGRGMVNLTTSGAIRTCAKVIDALAVPEAAG